jgi:flagellar basal-body rod modification protein FlgD
MDANLLNTINSPTDSSFAPVRDVKGKNDKVDKNEFIQLLVTQLKHQDPLNPMQNEEFAVQLAQFTQVEQLIKINDTLSAQNQKSEGDFNYLASYLGHEVWLNSDKVSVNGSQAGKVGFVLPQDAANVQIELVDKDGVVRDTVNAGPLKSGQNVMELKDLSTSSGEYQARVVASTLGGNQLKVEASVVGTVSGFVPGANPTLLIGDRELSTADIRRVTKS